MLLGYFAEDAACIVSRRCVLLVVRRLALLRAVRDRSSAGRRPRGLGRGHARHAGGRSRDLAVRQGRRRRRAGHPLRQRRPLLPALAARRAPTRCAPWPRATCPRRRARSRSCPTSDSTFTVSLTPLRRPGGRRTRRESREADAPSAARRQRELPGCCGTSAARCWRTRRRVRRRTATLAAERSRSRRAPRVRG